MSLETYVALYTDELRHRQPRDVSPYPYAIAMIKFSWEDNIPASEKLDQIGGVLAALQTVNAEESDGDR